MFAMFASAAGSGQMGCCSRALAHRTFNPSLRSRQLAPEKNWRHEQESTHLLQGAEVAGCLEMFRPNGQFFSLGSRGESLLQENGLKQEEGKWGSTVNSGTLYGGVMPTES